MSGVDSRSRHAGSFTPRPRRPRGQHQQACHGTRGHLLESIGPRVPRENRTTRRTTLVNQHRRSGSGLEQGGGPRRIPQNLRSIRTSHGQPGGCSRTCRSTAGIGPILCGDSAGFCAEFPGCRASDVTSDDAGLWCLCGFCGFCGGTVRAPALRAVCAEYVLKPGSAGWVDLESPQVRPGMPPG